MPKKILSAVLCFAMLLSLLPLTAFAELTVIDTVTISGVTAPELGKQASFDFEIPEDASYSPVSGMGDYSEVLEARWFRSNSAPEDLVEVLAGEEYDPVSYTDLIFLEGYYYTFLVPLEANEGFEFSADALVTINGEVCGFEAIESYYHAYYTFEPFGEEYDGDSIDLSMIMPKVGANPVFDCGIPLNAPYRCARVEWIETDFPCEDPLEAFDQGTTWSFFDLSQHIFEAYMCYTLVVYLEAIGDYEFSSELEYATLNGEPAPIDVFSNKDAAVWYTGEHLVPTPPFTVGFDANGGSGDMEPVLTDDNGFCRLPVCTFTPPEGQVFDKWIVDYLGEQLLEGAAFNACDCIHPGYDINDDINIYVYATWKDAVAQEPLNTLVLNEGKVHKNAISGQELTVPGITGTADGEGGYIYTFDGVNITSESELTVAVLDENATIALAPGSVNTVTAADNADTYLNATCIAAYGNLSITGSGSLEVITSSNLDGFGINVCGDLTVSDAAVTVTAVEMNNLDFNIGIWVRNNFVVNSGSVTSTGNSAADSYGILVYGDLVVNGGSVTGTSGADNYYCSGIYVENGDLIVSDGSVTGNGGFAELSEGIYVYNGNCIVSGGSVTGNGGEATDSSWGIYVYNRDLVVSGGSVTGNGGEATDSSWGIYVDNRDLVVSGGSVTGNGGEAAYVSKGIDIDEGNLIVSAGSVTGIGGSASGYEECYSDGIFAETSIEITGGSITGIGGTASGVEDHVPQWCHSIGVRCLYDVTVNGGSITGIGGTANASEDSESSGIRVSDGDLTVNGGEVTGIGGTATCEGDYCTSSGLYYAYYEEWGGNVTITGGKVTFSGNTAAIFNSTDGSSPITVDDGGEALMIVFAGADPSGSDAAELSSDDWEGNGADELENYKYMNFWDGVVIKTLTGISVTQAPEKTVYFAGESFDPAGMTVSAEYSVVSGDPTTTVTEPVTGYTVTDGANLPEGREFVTVSYTEGGVTKTATVAITVNPVIIIPTVAIKNNPGTREIKYGDGIEFTAVVTDIPAGAQIKWYVNGAEKGTGATFTFSDAKADATITVKIVDGSGNALTDAGGSEISDTETIKVKAGFFQKLISFFKNLFRLPRIVTQAFIKEQ